MCQKQLKDIGTFSLKWLEKILKKKKYKNHLRSNDYEVCTALARCIPNILPKNMATSMVI
jgi:hypothetical protein